MIRWLLILVALAPLLLQAQNFDQKTIDVGNIGLNLTNVGTLGRPNVRNSPEGAPSMEYPLNSGIEHLFEGGFWIGAQVDGQVRVSTSALDASSGYSTGRSGFEFTGYGPVNERSSLSQSENFSASAVSHQDMVISITDSNVVVPGTAVPINNHQFPLKASVQQEVYAWNYSFADFFCIVNYTIKNDSRETWDSVYFAWWSDMVVRNVNVTQDGGGAFFNKGGAGVLDDETSFYVFQVSGDDLAYTQSYGAATVLGVEWRDQYFHPNNAQSFRDQSLPEPEVHYNFWEFNSQSGGDFTFPATENDRYFRMKNSVGLNKPGFRDLLKRASNKIQLISTGPITQIEPGEEVKFVVALVCAKQLDDPNADETSDTEYARSQLMEHIGWAKRTYVGEDLNENGLLDEGEDLDDDGRLDRYILPEPPKQPNVHLVPGEGFLDIYWNDVSLSSVDPISKKEDFEGFKLYRSNLGDDLDRNLLSEANLVAQWDSSGNAVGFNNGFEEIELKKPLEVNDTLYQFHYRMEGLVSGWQYLFVLTAFDEGDPELGLEPLESSFSTNNYRVWTGAAAQEEYTEESAGPGVYPNPYRTTAGWDGNSSRTRKIYFYNLPAHCTITIFTSSGDLVDRFEHNADTYKGEDIRWFNDFGGEAQDRTLPGGEHAWDILSASGQTLAQGMYIFSVEDHANGITKKGTFAILK